MRAAPLPQRVLLALLVASSVAPLGCTDFDQQDKLEDIRVLGMRLDPPEIHYSPAYFLFPPELRAGVPLSEQTVQAEVYAFDPRGGLIETKVQLCPDEAGACLDFNEAAFISRFTPPNGELSASELQAAFTPRTDQSVVEPPDDPTGRVGGMRYRFELTSNVIDSLVQGQLSLFTLNPVIAVDVQNTRQTDPARERAFKRLPMLIDFDDPEFEGFADAFLAQLGFTLCPGELDSPDFREGLTDCLSPAPPNRNPDLLGFRLEEDFDSAPLGMRLGVGQANLEKRATLSAARGSTISLTPVLNDDVIERYQIISFDIETQQLLIKNRTEDLACNWYVTKGELSTQGNLTALQFQEKLTNTWELPSVDEAEAGEEVAIVLVVRDQRGGTDFGQITVVLR